MRADTVDWVTFILRAASMKLRVSATIKNVRARFTSIVSDQSLQALCDLSIEISDSGHRKIPFEAEHDSNQIGSVPTESERFDSYQLGVTTEGLTMVKAKKKAAKKPAAKKAAKKKKR